MICKATKLFAALVLAVCLFGCWLPPVESTDFPDNVQGYQAVYGSKTQSEIALLQSKPVRNPGKIYAYNNLLLVNELKEGIHIFDNSDPFHPKPLYFINILGNNDMAIKDDVLYADHNGDLKAIRLNGFTSLAVQDSLTLADWNLGVPPPRGFYFECVEPSKGIVIGWREIEIESPRCYATF
jgi:hypothetical protein